VIAKFPLVLASTMILISESLETHDHGSDSLQTHPSELKAQVTTCVVSARTASESLLQTIPQFLRAYFALVLLRVYTAYS
jgi:hypothetical protein